MRKWLVEDHLLGPMGLSNPNITGFFFDDNWGQNSHDKKWNQEQCNWGPSELESHCLVDMGLDAAAVKDLTAGWAQTILAANTAVLAHGGFVWQLFNGGKMDGTYKQAPGWLDGHTTVQPATCAAQLRLLCAADSAPQREATMYEWQLGQGAAIPPGKGGGHSPSNLTDVMQDLASFLLTRGKFAWIGTSWVGCAPANGPEGAFTNKTYARPPEVDVDYGKPLGLCKETASGSEVFTREYSKAIVQMECKVWKGSIVMKKTDDEDDNPCCKEVAHADCWGFTAGEDSTTSIQAAIDCTLAHTVVVKNMSGGPWIVAPQHEPTHLNATALGTVRTAINFSTSNQLIIFEPGVTVLAKRWAFHGMNDNLAYMGSKFGPVRNVTIVGEGAVFKMWKHDYQCTACPPSPSLPCDPCPACDPKSKLYNVTICYAKSEQRHGLNIWCGVDITVKGLTIDNSGGDGIMTGGLESGTAATRTRRVHIKEVTSSNNHRQGISVISAVGLLVEDSTFRDTNGTAPEAGVDIEADNTHSILVDIVFRRCRFADNNGCGVQMNIDALSHAADAPISITFEDCDVSWRDDFPFESPWFDGAGYLVGAGKAAGSVTVRGGTVQGSAGAGIEISGKPLSGPAVTFADVLLNNTGRVKFPQEYKKPWIHGAPIMLMDGGGGIGGVWVGTDRESEL